MQAQQATTTFPPKTNRERKDKKNKKETKLSLAAFHFQPEIEQESLKERQRKKSWKKEQKRVEAQLPLDSADNPLCPDDFPQLLNSSHSSLSFSPVSSERTGSCWPKLRKNPKEKKEDVKKTETETKTKTKTKTKAISKPNFKTAHDYLSSPPAPLLLTRFTKEKIQRPSDATIEKFLLFLDSLSEDFYLKQDEILFHAQYCGDLPLYYLDKESNVFVRQAYLAVSEFPSGFDIYYQSLLEPFPTYHAWIAFKFPIPEEEWERREEFRKQVQDNISLMKESWQQKLCNTAAMESHLKALHDQFCLSLEAPEIDFNTLSSFQCRRDSAAKQLQTMYTEMEEFIQYSQNAIYRDMKSYYEERNAQFRWPLAVVRRQEQQEQESLCSLVVEQLHTVDVEETEVVEEVEEVEEDGRKAREADCLEFFDAPVFVV